MTNELVLITGISGFIGYATLVHALESGYQVRGIVRKASQIDKIKVVLPTHFHALVEFAVIDDLSAKGAFEKQMRGVIYALHIASPMPGPFEDLERDFFRPAVDSTISLLSAAKASPTVKRIIITSSNAPFVPVTEFVQGKLTKEVLRSDDEICHYDMKIRFDNPQAAPILAYAASKSMALDAAEKFMETQRPVFDLVVLMPAYVFGPNRLSRTPEDFAYGSNSFLLDHLLGRPGAPLMTSSVHIDDVAKTHVLSLKSFIPAGRYLLASGETAGTDWSEAFQVIKKHFPEAVGATFVKDPEVRTIRVISDTLKAEQAFGIKFKSFKEQVKDAVGYYLSL
ncbi:putative uncharacterized oxidoreductase [Lachnellula subtilissima]|uniref:Uncharacterized oxidoreductase n=1 Tax=Lachnellula subtilissima TaxID=602034 RepID=A0A8H8RD37_9HELO|nr:putative uncharacterized oxidoreductase [Lachnellula subtilissima]